ncbi:MAG: hypothetical protein Q9191_007408 [Dirinaria sp. TL-2023a]
MLPPLSSGPEIPAEHAPYYTGRTWSSSQHQSPSSPLYYGQHTFQEPSQAPWSARLPLERIMSRPEQDRPASSGTVHPPSSPAQSSYRSYAYHDPGQTSPVRMRTGFPSLPSPSGQDMRPLMAEPTRYRASSTTMPSTRRESESSRSSATSSSAYGSALSIPAQPTGLTASQSSDITSRYILRVRQQPIAARACGFGERDRRVIDPPPIVQLSLADYDPTSPEDVAELKHSLLVVQCTLLSVPSQSSWTGALQDVTAIPEPNDTGRLTRKLTGTLVASPFVGVDLEAPSSRDENARIGCFFIFPDLSCRQVGCYRLRFHIMKMGPGMLNVGGSTPIVRTVESNNFEVYSAKDFPGMRASTALTKDLKRQGASVSVKKGNEGLARRGNRKRTSSPSETNEEPSERSPATAAPSNRSRQ